MYNVGRIDFQDFLFRRPAEEFKNLEMEEYKEYPHIIDDRLLERLFHIGDIGHKVEISRISFEKAS